MSLFHATRGLHHACEAHPLGRSMVAGSIAGLRLELSVRGSQIDSTRRAIEGIASDVRDLRQAVLGGGR